MPLIASTSLEMVAAWGSAARITCAAPGREARNKKVRELSGASVRLVRARKRSLCQSDAASPWRANRRFAQEAMSSVDEAAVCPLISARSAQVD